MLNENCRSFESWTESPGASTARQALLLTRERERDGVCRIAHLDKLLLSSSHIERLQWIKLSSSRPRTFPFAAIMHSGFAKPILACSCHTNKANLICC